MKTSLLILALLTTACETRPAVPDMSPVGDGLKVIGFSLIAVAVVITVGRFLRPPPSP